MSETTDHGLTCTCGETFQTPDAYTEHVTVEQVLAEVKAIGGEKFHRVIKEDEQNAHAGNLSELADQLDITFTPENARELAKEAVAHYVRSYDEYLLDERGETDAGEQ